MVRKAVWLLISAALVAVVASQWDDISRYVKIKQMSFGTGHPENVPAGGKAAYAHPSAEEASETAGQSERPAGGSTARDRTGVDPQEPIDDSSPDLQQS